MNKKHIAGYIATAVVALGIGAAGSSGSAEGTTPQSAAPTVTVTATNPDSAAAAPAVTQTIEVPGPTVEVPGPVKTVTVGPPPPAVAMDGDGTYEVGVDVKPGKFVSSKPDSGNCYWARLSGSDGLDSIIDNGNSSGQVVVTIKKSDKFFESNGCNSWSRR